MIESILLKISHIQNSETIHVQFWNLVEKLINESELISTSAFIQHGNTTVLLHSIAVAYYSYLIASALRRDSFKSELITGALFHDYFLYDWHIRDKSHRLHGFYHPKKALENTQKIINLTDREQNIICRHMFPLTLIPPKYFESVLVCMVDKSCSVYETFKKNAYPKLEEQIAIKVGQK